MSKELIAHGDDGAGYRVELEEQARTVRIRMWGFWSIDLAKAFADEVLAASEPELRSGVAVEIDASGLSPMRDEAQAEFAKLIAGLLRLQHSRITVVTDRQLTKMQLFRVVRDKGGAEEVQFVGATI